MQTRQLDKLTLGMIDQVIPWLRKFIPEKADSRWVFNIRPLKIDDLSVSSIHYVIRPIMTEDSLEYYNSQTGRYLSGGTMDIVDESGNVIYSVGQPKVSIRNKLVASSKFPFAGCSDSIKFFTIP